MDLIESALLQVRQLASTANESFRRKLMTALHELAYSMEEPDDTIHRYGYLVSLSPCPYLDYIANGG
jgi:hypothetical protein